MRHSKPKMSPRRVKKNMKKYGAKKMPTSSVRGRKPSRQSFFTGGKQL